MVLGFQHLLPIVCNVQSPAGTNTWRSQTQGKTVKLTAVAETTFRVALDRILRNSEASELEGRNGGCRGCGSGPRPHRPG